MAEHFKIADDGAAIALLAIGGVVYLPLNTNFQDFRAV